MSNQSRVRTVAMFAAVLCLNVYCTAQSVASGRLSGTVLDPHHRVIAGAKVTIRNADFSWQRVLTSDASGNFVAISLPAGTYAIQAEAHGFKPKKANRVLVSVGSSVRLNLQHEVAGSSSEVTVTGRAPTVEGNTVAP